MAILDRFFARICGEEATFALFRFRHKGLAKFLRASSIAEAGSTRRATESTAALDALFYDWSNGLAGKIE
jgi:hypothetical protein